MLKYCLQSIVSIERRFVFNYTIIIHQMNYIDLKKNILSNVSVITYHENWIESNKCTLTFDILLGPVKQSLAIKLMWCGNTFFSFRMVLRCSQVAYQLLFLMIQCTVNYTFKQRSIFDQETRLFSRKSTREISVGWSVWIPLLNVIDQLCFCGISKVHHRRRAFGLVSTMIAPVQFTIVLT